jgi:hypothetical protein
VRRNIPATASARYPKVPEIVLVKNNAANTNAMKIRMILSVVPMFFFITYVVGE